MATSSLEDFYPYHVVEFIHPGKKPKVRNVDVVATKWIIVDDKKKKLFVKYPPPPYTSVIRSELDRALEYLSDAPSSWQTYTIQLKGKASKCTPYHFIDKPTFRILSSKEYIINYLSFITGNLEEAFKKCDLLQSQETAYTMDSNDSCTEVEKKGTELLRQHRLQKEASSFMSALSESLPSSQTKPKGNFY